MSTLMPFNACVWYVKRYALQKRYFEAVAFLNEARMVACTLEETLLTSKLLQELSEKRRSEDGGIEDSGGISPRDDTSL